LKGLVLRSTGKWYTVRTETGELVEAQLKGKIRLLELDVTNPIAVGDIVNLEDSDGTWMITSIDERKNFIIRLSPKKKFMKQIIASNIDQAVLIVTLNKPRTSSGFIDRFLLTAEAYHIPTIIVFNKQDILRERDQEKQAEFIEIYEKIGYNTLLTSATTGLGVDSLKKLITNKTTLLSGHSGVGKSTLTNAVDSSLDLKTKDVSKKFSKGVHTTTHAQMYELPFGGNVIDVPGIKEFGIAYFDKYEVAQYFREFKALASQCKFSDCLHIEEPNCAIKNGVSAGVIHPERYINYLNILDSIEEMKEY
tara:strand:- start:15872 stop:16792 length:921 start_codon:yes stop_codon:yes gene_type:complete